MVTMYCFSALKDCPCTTVRQHPELSHPSAADYKRVVKQAEDPLVSTENKTSPSVLLRSSLRLPVLVPLATRDCDSDSTQHTG